jgi:hypothetical protein
VNGGGTLQGRYVKPEAVGRASGPRKIRPSLRGTVSIAFDTKAVAINGRLNSGWGSNTGLAFSTRQKINQRIQRRMHVRNRILHRIQMVLQRYRHFRQRPAVFAVE